QLRELRFAGWLAVIPPCRFAASSSTEPCPVDRALIGEATSATLTEPERRQRAQHDAAGNDRPRIVVQIAIRLARVPSALLGTLPGSARGRALEFRQLLGHIVERF